MDDFDPTKLVQYAWDCKEPFAEMVTLVSLELIRATDKKIKELARRQGLDPIAN